MYIGVAEDTLEVNTDSLSAFLIEVHNCCLSFEVAVVEVFWFRCRQWINEGLCRFSLPVALGSFMPSHPFLELLNLLHLLHHLQLEDLYDVAVVLDGLRLALLLMLRHEWISL